MKQKIIGFQTDDEGHWRAALECGHFQHVRHEPPLTTRHWVLTEVGRAQRIGYELECKRCEEEREQGSFRQSASNVNKDEQRQN